MYTDYFRQLSGQHMYIHYINVKGSQIVFVTKES